MKNKLSFIEKVRLILLWHLFLPSFIHAQPVDKRAGYDISKDKVLYTIGYAHLDTEWNWDYPQTINVCLKNTLTENFYLFEKYPEYVFNFTGSRRYHLMKEYYPELYDKLKNYIAEGRWYVSGSSVDEGEVNISSSESLVRQVLYGNHYFKKEFGVTSADYMLPDCFGFLANLPSIWNHCGLLGFSTQKLTWRAATPIPFNVGVWNGPDDKGIVAALNATSYTSHVEPRLDLDEKWIKRIDEGISKHDISFDYRYYGVGDEGGSPRERDIKNATESLHNPDSKLKILLTSSDQIYKDITPGIRKKLPVYSGDLLLIEHSAGSLTSQSYMKRLNRKNEILAQEAENLAVMADWTGISDYPTEKLNKSWELVLGSQFHDILPGTSIPEAYEYAWNDEFIAANGFAHVLENSVRTLSAFMNTQTKGRSVLVYNPVALKREDIVTVELEYGNVPEAIKIFDYDNKEVPVQITERTDHTLKAIFLAKVPAMGLAIFDVQEAKETGQAITNLMVSDNKLENQYYTVNLNNQGDIESIYDKKAHKEILERPACLEFLHESPEHWPAWNMDWEDRKNQPIGNMNESATLRIIENGPVRVAIEVKKSGHNSNITQIISLAAGQPGEKVEISNVLDWQSKGVSLKASFPLAVSNKVATYNLGVGTIERANNNEVKFEVPSKEWFDLTDRNGSYGVTILEDCKYGSDKPADNELRLTLMYTPEPQGDWFPVQASQDWGVHEFRYGIYGHKGNWKDANSAVRGNFFNQPLMAFEVDKHAGNWGNNISFLSVNKSEIDVMAFKKAENSEYYIIRVNELEGKDLKKGAVIFNSEIADAYEVNGQEGRIGNASFSGNQIIFDLSRYTIKSFAVKFKPTSVTSSVTQRNIELPFNQDVFTADYNRQDGSFIHGRTYPAEMVSDVIKSEGIQFKMGDRNDEGLNALACKGQEINIPSGTFTKIHILAAANEDTEGDFRIGDNSVKLSVQPWTGFIGQHYNRRFGLDNITVIDIDPPYVKTDNIAWFASHHHKNYPSANEAYQYSYMYKYDLDLPKGAGKIILPDNDKIKILAITVTNGDNTTAKPLQPVYDNFEGYRKTVWTACRL